MAADLAVEVLRDLETRQTEGSAAMATLPTWPYVIHRLATVVV
jgi:hypothetical protein